VANLRDQPRTRVDEEPNFSKFALHGALDWYSSLAVDHLSRRTMAPAPPAPDPHAPCWPCYLRLHDQAVGGGNFRGALRSVHRGSLHARVHAEHYCESRSEPHPGESLYVYFRRTSPLYSFIDPNPSKDREWVLTVAHFGLFNNAERCLFGTLE
jgi:hypothetical protein